jgi:hypothetical protein
MIGGRCCSQLVVIVASALGVLASSRHVAAGEPATAPALKAAFLYSFARFTEWPSEVLAPGQKLDLCVLGDKGVAEALEQTIKGRSLDGHGLFVQTLKTAEPIRSCHLLYVSGFDAMRSAEMIDFVKRAPVLTVSDCDMFVELGGIAQLILEKGRIRFTINVGSARRSRLTLSSNLLRLAGTVRDDHNVQP